MTDALDAATVRRLFREHGPMVYRRALRILGNAADAEEALQEVFVRVLRGGESFEQRSQVTTWLYRITTNYCLNFLRDSKRRRELLETHLSEPDEGAGSAPHELVLMRDLLKEADESQAQAAIYVHLDGMSHDEAAEVLGVSRRTVGNLLERFAGHAKKRMESARPPASDAASAAEQSLAVALERAARGGGK